MTMFEELSTRKIKCDICGGVMLPLPGGQWQQRETEFLENGVKYAPVVELVNTCSEKRIDLSEGLARKVAEVDLQVRVLPGAYFER